MFINICVLFIISSLYSGYNCLVNEALLKFRYVIYWFIVFYNNFHIEFNQISGF
jgi:hypothetical protein